MLRGESAVKGLALIMHEGSIIDLIKWFSNIKRISRRPHSTKLCRRLENIMKQFAETSAFIYTPVAFRSVTHIAGDTFCRLGIAALPTCRQARLSY